MRKGLIIGVILGIGAGVVINKILSKKSIDDIKKEAKENLSKVKENIEKAKYSIEEYRSKNASNMKIDI